MSRRALTVWGALMLVVAPLRPARAQGGLEIRAGASTMFSHRAAQFEGGVGTGSGTMPGVEFLVRGRRVGLAGRILGGGFSADSGSEALGRVHIADVRVLAGPRIVSADVGYGRRAFAGALGDRSWALVRLGLRSALPIGTSGLSAEFLMAYTAGLGGSHGTGTASGREAETRLVYTPARVPVYAAVGYRHERFTVLSALDTRPEEVTGLIFAAGLRVRP